ncbi:MAG: ABC transporter substrate-binding protein [Pseudomonadales bacterium]|nr:ABC transporter substrate-binding protein [Pseudomonadales bacterium]MDP7360047.1 ABC transporter substrate-binding protein [Pseudomonadales bacterium]MDP7598121.1 ABC transporter substrate-binding protein [Pseudomonadales bacterium]HJN49382.1 ABC transporter substrate-binding protein [Pseudomonadales bacterium]
MAVLTNQRVTREKWSALFALIALLVTPSVPADDGLTLLPPEWYKAPQTASQLGIERFSESPLLAGRDLPPVGQRLPEDPQVIVPFGEIGKYGGKARITLGDGWTFFNWEAALTISPDLRTLLPNLARTWTVSADGRTITIHLRRGLKWSDGMPLTSDDFVFTFDHIWMDPEFSPVTSRLVVGGTIVKVDDLSIRYVFEKPNPLFVNLIAQYGNFMVDPKHYYRNWHPAFVDRDELNERIKEMGFISWMAFVDAQRNARIEESVDVPTLRAYRVVSRTPIMMRFERNPYYHKVDPAGQQLPYIDAIDAEIILDNSELVTAKASAGQLDFAAFALRTQDIPLLKLGERHGQVKVNVWRRLHTSDVVIQPNYNYADKRLRELYWDKRFRHALSHAINRQEMNEIIYFGRGVPQQVTVHPSSVFYEPRFATAYTRYDPDRAKALLDEIGVRDINSDGLREYPDGSELIITMEFLDFETPKGITMELVSAYWRAVGVDMRLKLVDRALQSARAQAGAMQMTLWHADFSTDILFPILPRWWVPMYTGWDSILWNDWVRYFLTDGRLGEEPPPAMQELQRWSDELRWATDPAVRLAAGKKILASSAENLWTFGTVGLAPHPVVISSRLKNVIPNGIWGWDNRWTLSYHPSTWYFQESDDVAVGSDD